VGAQGGAPHLVVSSTTLKKSAWPYIFYFSNSD
jgi:hypothetical protein